MNTEATKSQLSAENGTNVSATQVADTTDKAEASVSNVAIASTDNEVAMSEPPNKKRRPSYDSRHERDWRERRDAEVSRRSFNHRGSDRKPPFPLPNRSKFDPGSLPESDDPNEIRKQVEFYFSDSNLLTDKFLLEKTGGRENRPVPIATIHSFKRMRHFQPFSAVVAALKDSKTLVVTDDEDIKRRIPLHDAAKVNPRNNFKYFEDSTRSRSIYAKGFGEETPSTQFDIEAFFAPFGPTNAIRLRRQQDKTFKGSVFVEFENEATAKAFLDLDPKPKWEGENLKIMSKDEYLSEKAEELKKRGIEYRDKYSVEQRDKYGSKYFSSSKKEYRHHKDHGSRGRGDSSGRGNHSYHHSRRGGGYGEHNSLRGSEDLERSENERGTDKKDDGENDGTDPTDQKLAIDEAKDEKRVKGAAEEYVEGGSSKVNKKRTASELGDTNINAQDDADSNKRAKIGEAKDNEEHATSGVKKEKNGKMGEADSEEMVKSEEPKASKKRAAPEDHDLKSGEMDKTGSTKKAKVEDAKIEDE